MNQIRTYKIDEVVSFRKTTEAFGGLSNMAAGYSLNVNGIIILTAEHLYQACRFPHHPEIQEAIIREPSPIKAKWISRKHIDHTRHDWNKVRVKLMKWCLTIKLAQNWDKFSALLLETDNKPIVEFTNKDKMWGAVKEGECFKGVNALGRLLMQLREDYIVKGCQPYCVEPPEVTDLYLFSSKIDVVCNDTFAKELYYSAIDTLELA